MARIKDLLSLIIILLLIYASSRIVFLYDNLESFASYGKFVQFKSILQGLIYDFYLIAIINSLFIILYLYPSKFYNNLFYQSFLKIYYVAINSLALFISLFDADFFRLNGIRLDYNNFYFELRGFFEHIPAMNFEKFMDHYVMLLFYWITMMVVLSYAVWFIRKRVFEHELAHRLYKYSSFSLVAIYLICLPFFLSDDTAWIKSFHSRTPHQLSPLVMNNPYLILQTSKCDYLQYNDSLEFNDFNPVRNYHSLDTIENQILRLFMIKSDKGENILKESGVDLSNMLKFKVLSRTNADIFRLLDEVLIGIPGILDGCFYQSPYSLNRFETLPEILQNIGYHTSVTLYGCENENPRLVQNFYGFDSCSVLDRNSTNLFQDSKPQQAKTTKEFELYLLNIDNRENKPCEEFLKTRLSCIHDSIGSKKILNILFFYNTGDNQGVSRIDESLFILTDIPKDLVINDSIVSQALDLMPTILNYLNYSKPFISYGSSLFSNGGRVVLDIPNNKVVNIFKGNLLLKMTNNETTCLQVLGTSKFTDFNFKDSLIVEKIDIENTFQALCMDFFQRLQNNQLFQNIDRKK